MEEERDNCIGDWRVLVARSGDDPSLNQNRAEELSRNLPCPEEIGYQENFSFSKLLYVKKYCSLVQCKALLEKASIHSLIHDLVTVHSAPLPEASTIFSPLCQTQTCRVATFKR